MYTTQLLLDEKAAEYVKEIWEKLSTNGIDSTLYNIENLYPHITLAVYEDINVAEFIEKLKAFKNEIKPIKITFDILGCFPTTNTCFTAPNVTRKMLEIHNKYYNFFSEYNESAKSYYLPDKWVPHCSLTIGINKEISMKTMEYVYSIFKPFEATLEDIALYKVEYYEDNKIDSVRLF